jgi:hypothetical protein
MSNPSSSSSSLTADAGAAELLATLEAKARETFGEAEPPAAIADKLAELRARAGRKLSATACAAIDALARSRRWDLEHGLTASAEATAQLMSDIVDADLATA